MSEKNTLSAKWWILGLLTPPLVWADLYTKVLIGRRFYPGEHLTVIDGFFDLMFARNRGAAFGLFNDLSPEMSFAFFIGVSIIALLVLGYLWDCWSSMRLSVRRRLRSARRWHARRRTRRRVRRAMQLRRDAMQRQAMHGCERPTAAPTEH